MSKVEEGGKNEPVKAANEAVVISKDPVLVEPKVEALESSKDDRAATALAKLADLRSNLSFEEKKEYEKYRSAPEKLKDDAKPKEEKEAAPTAAASGPTDPISDDEIIEISTVEKSKDKDADPVLHRRLKMGRRPAAGNPLYDKGFSNLKAHYRKDLVEEDRGRNRDKRPDFDRRRGRSRSRSRSRSRERRKRRSDSPYSIAYDNWKRFKQAERVMFEAVNRKREIYDKRPEDHPQYPEEWRIFWEKRYKEVQAQGRNADAYNYKPDWIPYWAKKVEELYRNEVLVKTQDLLTKYNLTNPNEPVRADFPAKRLRPDPVEERFRKRSRSRSRDRERSTRHRRSFSPSRNDHHGRGSQSRRSNSPGYNGYDRYSGISELENIRDRGLSRTPPRYREPFEEMSRGRLDLKEPPRIMETLRLVTALEDLLGSLGPQINALMSRCLSLETKRKDSSNLLLEDANAAAILELTKEKLAGQVVAGLLLPNQEDTVKVCMNKLNCLLMHATKKRPDGPPSIKGCTIFSEVDEKENLKKFFAENLAKQMVLRGMFDFSEWELHKLVYAIAQKTALDDGTLAPPPKAPPRLPTPPPPQPPQQKYGGYYGGPPGYPPVNQMMGPGPSSGYDQPPAHAKQHEGNNGPAYSTPIYADNKGGVDEDYDEFDDLTVEELRSLLDNFKNLSKGEQMDLIRYMRKLESTDPEKVKLLKQSVKPGSKDDQSKTPIKNNDSRPSSQASSSNSGSRSLLGGPPPPPPPPEEQAYPPHQGRYPQQGRGHY